VRGLDLITQTLLDRRARGRKIGMVIVV